MNETATTPTTTFPSKLVLSAAVLRDNPSILFHKYDGTRLVLVKELLNRSLTGLVTRFRLPKLIDDVSRKDPSSRGFDKTKASDLAKVTFSEEERRKVEYLIHDFVEVMPGFAWGGITFIPKEEFPDKVTSNAEQLAIYAKGSGPDTGVVVEGPEAQILEAIGIQVVSPEELDKRRKDPDQALVNSALRMKSLDMVLAIVLLLIVLGVTFFGTFRILVAPVPYDELPYWLSVPMLLAMGALAYWLRRHARLWYGIAELAVGVATAFFAFWDKGGTQGHDINWGLKCVAAVYVLVRGLDNIGEALDKQEFQYPLAARLWKKVFGQRTS